MNIKWYEFVEYLVFGNRRISVERLMELKYDILGC